MTARGLGLLAALALLVACDREAPPRPARPAAASTAQPASVRFVAPVAAQDQPSPASPSPTASASPARALAGAPEPKPAHSSAPLVPLASYPPRDECATLPGFAAFRDRLGAAVRSRDAEALAALADPAIRLDFGGGAGRDELRARLGKRPELWSEFAELLPLGCAADAGLATIPWVFSRMPESVDPYRGMLVTGEHVALRERPAPGAPSRVELSWALVAQVGEVAGPRRAYTQVETGEGGLRGFVETRQLRSLLDYRIVAEPQAAGWAITAFTAGD